MNVRAFVSPLSLLALAGSAGVVLAVAGVLSAPVAHNPSARAVTPSSPTAAPATSSEDHRIPLAQVYHRTISVAGQEIFYRESGPKDAPAILLLHGFPTSSVMFRDLIPFLGTKYRVIAPDYPGFGHSSMPARDAFEYSFDNLSAVITEFIKAVELNTFTMYVQDYGAPVGFRIASQNPASIDGLIIQNGNAYDEGLDNEFWKPIKAYWNDPSAANRDALRPFLTIDGTKWQYTHGARDLSAISPDAWTIDQARLDRPGNAEIQLDLFLSYGTNPPHYPSWQQYFREHQPPTLIVWGKRDQIFPEAGAHPYLRDLKNVDFNILDTGHFALEEDGSIIAEKILNFMTSRVVNAK